MAVDWSEFKIPDVDWNQFSAPKGAVAEEDIQHPDIGTGERARLMAMVPEAAKRTLEKKFGPGNVIHEGGYNFKVKKAGEATWKKLDPSKTEWQDFTTDIISDVLLTLGYIGGGAAGVTSGLLGTGGLASFGMGVAGAAGGGAATRSLINTALMGMGEENVAPFEGAATEAAMGATAEVGGRALGYGLKKLPGALKWPAKKAMAGADKARAALKFGVPKTGPMGPPPRAPVPMPEVPAAIVGRGASVGVEDAKQALLKYNQSFDRWVRAQERSAAIATEGLPGTERAAYYDEFWPPIYAAQDTQLSIIQQFERILADKGLKPAQKYADRAFKEFYGGAAPGAAAGAEKITQAAAPAAGKAAGRVAKAAKPTGERIPSLPGMVALGASAWPISATMGVPYMSLMAGPAVAYTGWFAGRGMELVPQIAARLLNKPWVPKLVRTQLEKAIQIYKKQGENAYKQFMKRLMSVPAFRSFMTEIQATIGAGANPQTLLS